MQTAPLFKHSTRSTIIEFSRSKDGFLLEGASPLHWYNLGLVKMLKKLCDGRNGWEWDGQLSQLNGLLGAPFVLMIESNIQSQQTKRRLCNSCNISQILPNNICDICDQQGCDKTGGIFFKPVPCQLTLPGLFSTEFLDLTQIALLALRTLFLVLSGWISVRNDIRCQSHKF